MGDVVNQLDVVDLVDPVVRDGLVSSQDTTAIRRDELRLVTELSPLLRVRKSVQRRIEQIENEMSVFNQMSVSVPQAGELLLRCDQVLEGSIRECDQVEGSPEIKAAHVGPDELSRRLNLCALLCELLSADGQHIR